MSDPEATLAELRHTIDLTDSQRKETVIREHYLVGRLEQQVRELIAELDRLQRRTGRHRHYKSGVKLLTFLKTGR